MLEMYKIVYRNFAQSGTDFVIVVPEIFNTYEDAKEGMLAKGKELEKQIASQCLTKADIYRYSTEMVEYPISDSGKPMRAVVLQKNILTYCSSPIAYLQIIKV